MTKWRVALPSTVVAEQEPFFITLGGLKAHDSSVEKNTPKEEHPHRDLFAALRFGRDDKGEGGASRQSSC
jgi:hypothetical protein